MNTLNNIKPVDFLIIGAGVIGLTIARCLIRENSNYNIIIIEKEEDVAKHASGRNSGVLHAGFYYTADSLKAKFTAEGNKAMREFCKEKGITVNECGKLVVAKTEEELQTLYELERRGLRNGVKVQLIDDLEAKRLEPEVKTYRKALFSPTTASVNPIEVCNSLKEEVLQGGVNIYFNCEFISRIGKDQIKTSLGEYTANYIINAAGLYADKIAQQFGFGKDYVILPFKGIYLEYDGKDIHKNIYPVPLLKNPFLGVHFTKTADGRTKIGPTAIPAFWRENYSWRNFKFKEFLTIFYYESILFFTNKFGFRDLAIEEIKKYRKKNLIQSSQHLADGVCVEKSKHFTKPGIRAQLLHKKNLTLVQDFIVEGDEHSIHILNAVSPAFTCSIPFSKYLVEMIKEKKQGIAKR
ncbi:L-2-hydroxyglutarate oxidase [Candidatus Woesearchaeota archaeon]|nr:L-2-hydroxyglutarate oxidase [Candidatus Woesearchaeota archaeon]